MTELEQVQQQLIELQSQLAFQDDTIASLNEALTEQQQEILVLRRQMTLLKQRQDEQAATLGSGEAPTQEKPPHY
ncbi:SlyX family protein [Halioglobus maricola]|uniref:SlyX family protein n=1 Tax=Halioglobus maricola TaxID=2601894 RepID=A0A5P9NL53_9GAMM|nr:SlyX family protein [Halioglobus maricola]QFU76226.1 SlyX family protein [Halioglobus maricola]